MSLSTAGMRIPAWIAWSRLALLALAPGVGVRAQDSRPNILVLRTDDQDAALMSVRRPDNGDLAMQHVHDLLQVEGLTFTHAIVSSPLCSPSRASFLTGQYAHNHHVLTNSPPFGGYGALDSSRTLPVWLANAGYSCVHVGKYLNEYSAGAGIPPGWEEWYTLLQSRYFDYFLDENGSLVHYGYGAQDYNTDVLARKAVDYVERHVSDPRPFFLVVDFTAPHKTSPPAFGTGSLPLPAPRHGDVFSGWSPTFPPSFNELDVSDKPRFILGLPLLTVSATRAVVDVERHRVGTLLAVDEAVARLLGALERTGRLSNTFVFFTSDNGFEQGEHRISTGKDVMYEESIRVPLVVRGPGVARGAEESALVSCIDLAPTILELSHATPDVVEDGRSMVPLFAGTHPAWRQELLVEIYPITGGGGHPTARALCTRDFRYIEHDYDSDGTMNECELYPLAPGPCGSTPDPFQLESQHANPCYAARIRRMHELVERLGSCAGGDCR